MEYVNNPNLPSNPVIMAVVDGRIGRSFEKILVDRGIDILKTEALRGLYNAVAYHPDIMLHPLGDEFIVCAPGISSSFTGELEKRGFRIITGQSVLTGKYPGNTAYNVCRIGSYAFHNTDYTDPVLRYHLEKRGVQLVHVKQGYTKCAVSIVNSTSFITADRGIAKAAEKYKFEVLLIEPEENILLHELDYGFIGGSTGLIDKNKWALSGSLKNLKASGKIREFLKARSIGIVCPDAGAVEDMGTIIPLIQKGS